LIVTFSERAQETNVPDPMAQLTPQFLEILQAEAAHIQQELESGLEPVRAHARTLLWLDALTKLHSSALDEAIDDGNPDQAAIWSRDLTGLEYALGMVLNIQPLLNNSSKAQS